MKVLLLGSGGREHALAWKMAQSKQLEKLYISPGNAGTAMLGENLDFAADNFEALGKFAMDNQIDLVVVGPEDPLVKGIVDYFKEIDELRNIPVIGPSKEAAQLEGSKEYAKEFMQKNSIPTAKYLSVTQENLQEGMAFLETMNSPYVLKADGLAAGKGVLIIDSLEEAKSELSQMLDGKFGAASSKVVIEEHLSGIELSVFVITDGENYITLPEAKDYKRIGEGDTGLNTGGMGCVSPVPFAGDEFMAKVEERIIKPTINGFKEGKLDYTGFVFIGLMNCQGDPYVIEYNVRMGDPETEVIMPRLECDLVEVFKAVAARRLNEVEISIKEEACVTVMLVSGGYPGSYEKGKEITGIADAKESMIFHAGTSLSEGKTVTSGGRVIAVSSMAKDFEAALKKSYINTDIIQFEGKNFRKDIGFDLK